MRAYNIGSIVMMVVLIGFVLVVTGRLIWIRYIKKSKVEFKNYIKTYKYGKFLWVYLLAIPLFFMSYHYAGYNGFDCFFRSFTSASKLFVLQFDVSLDLVKVNELYKITVILCYCIAILNLLLFVTSCLVQAIWNGLARIGFLGVRKNKCLILGNNPKNELFYNSIQPEGKKNKVRKMIADVLDKSGRWDLYTKDIHYHSSTRIEDLQKYIEKLLKKYDKKFKKSLENNWWNKLRAKLCKKHANKKFPKFQIVINFGDINKNANMCTFLSKLISTYAEDIKNNDVKENENKDAKDNKDKAKEEPNYLPYLDVYIYTTQESKALYKNLNNQFSGCLHLVNEEEMIATDFIRNYPVAKYLTKEQIDYDTSLLKNNTKISISFVGFGKTQQQIFKSLYSNTQFVKEVNGEIVGQPVEYHIYDKNDTWNEPEFRLTFNRYRDEFLAKCDKTKYYPLAQITEPEFIVTDITSNEFAENSSKLLEQHNEGNNIKYIVISLGNEFASLDYANKLWQTIRNKNIKNCHLFIKANDIDSYKNIERIFKNKNEQIATNSRNVYGCLIDTAYNYEHVMMNDISDLGIMLDALYDKTSKTNEEEKKLKFEDKILENARNKWTFKQEYNRYQSNSSALNLRSKLLCMGYDCVKESDPRPAAFATNAAYWEKLDKEGCRPIAGPKDNGVTFLALYYDKDYYFNTNSRRWALIVSEHNRWDAFQRTIGFIPREKADVINNGKEKDENKGLHPCITTMRGLETMSADLVAYDVAHKDQIENFNLEITKELRDKIQLDRLSFDGAWFLLKKIGYKIIKKEEYGNKTN